MHALLASHPLLVSEDDVNLLIEDFFMSVIGYVDAFNAARDRIRIGLGPRPVSRLRPGEC